MKRIAQTLILLSCFAATVGALVLSNRIERIFLEWRPLTAAVVGTLLSAILFLSILRAQKLLCIPYDSKPMGANSWIGVLYSSLAFITSFLFLVPDLSEVASRPSAQLLLDQALFQLRPALIEEVGFRFGIVVFAVAFFGRIPGLIAGSIPFGILHLLNFLSGQPIYWEYIIGTSIAGLFLTLIFMGFGLVAAILAHYTWNVLASVSSEVFRIPQENIEGGTPTLLVLLVLCAWVYFKLSKIPQPHNPPSA